MKFKRNHLLGNQVSTLFSTSDFMSLPHPTRLYFYKAVLNDIEHFSPFKNHSGGLKKFTRFILHQEKRLEKLYHRNPVYFINAMNFLGCNSFSMQLFELLNYVISNCCFTEDSPLGTVLVYYRKMIVPLMNVYGMVLNMTGPVPRVSKATQMTSEKVKEHVQKSVRGVVICGYSLLLLSLVTYSVICIVNLGLYGMYQSMPLEATNTMLSEVGSQLAILGGSSDIPTSKTSAILVDEGKLPLSFLVTICLVAGVSGWLGQSAMPLDEKFWYLNIPGHELTPEDAIEDAASSSIGLVNYFDVGYWLRDTSIATSGGLDYAYPF